MSGKVKKKFLAFLKLIEKPGQFLLLRTEILQKTVVGCPCNKHLPLSRPEALFFSITLTCLNRDNGHFPVSRARGGTPHMKGVGMLVVVPRGINFGFWSHLGCSGQKAIIFSREGLV